MVKIPEITRIDNPAILRLAEQLPKTGKLEISANQLTYLNVLDEYIHELYPLLEDKTIQKPAYFGKGKVGAHISVIYPEEAIIANFTEHGRLYDFTIRDLVVAKIGMRNYYVLLVESPELQLIRHKYQLPAQLNFKGYAINFHITIGSLPG